MAESLGLIVGDSRGDRPWVYLVTVLDAFMENSAMCSSVAVVTVAAEVVGAEGVDVDIKDFHTTSRRMARQGRGLQF